MEEQTRKELEWKEPTKLPEGKHTGTITRIEYKTEPYEYTEVFIEIDKLGFEIKYGCPTILSENSKLGKLMLAIGEEYKPGKKIIPEKALIGKRVEFMTINKKSKRDNREYAEIVEDSVKPLEEKVSTN